MNWPAACAAGASAPAPPTWEPAGGQRRVAGLCREEVAQLALPGPGVIDTHILASVLRLMDRLSDVPVLVTTVAGEIVAANQLATALFGEASGGSRRERTLAWRQFMGFTPVRVTKAEEDRVDAEEVLVADLQYALARYPANTYLSAMISDLREHSPRFEELWTQHRLRRGHAKQKHFDHPDWRDRSAALRRSRCLGATPGAGSEADGGDATLRRGPSRDLWWHQPRRRPRRDRAGQLSVDPSRR